MSSNVFCWKKFYKYPKKSPVELKILSHGTHITKTEKQSNLKNLEVFLTILIVVVLVQYIDFLY